MKIIYQIILMTICSAWAMKSFSANPVICMNSSGGNFCAELYVDKAPNTVLNFLNYVNSKAYENMIIHRSVPGFVVQTGGYQLAYNTQGGLDLNTITAGDAVLNEYNVSNTRGTLAMAKVSGEPNSATKEWFVNLADNSENLNNQNGGFTVFGKVLDDGMDAFDKIAAYERFNIQNVLSEVPLTNYTAGQTLAYENFVVIDNLEYFSDGNKTVVNASCGSSDGLGSKTIPTANLCDVGTAGSVSGSGPWTWSCQGRGAGISDTCSSSADTTENKIAGLYVAFFNRAPDQSGLDYWKQQSASLSDDSALKTLAAGFAQHTKFASLYDNLNNQAYVEAIYVNTLGQAGDNAGIMYWSNLIENGLTRSDMVSNFISSALGFNREDPQYATLTSEELDSAQQRRDLIKNKADVGLRFVQLLGSNTNLSSSTDANDPASLDVDVTYQASKNILSNISHDVQTKTVANNLLSQLLANKSSSMAIINEVVKQNGSITDDATIVNNAISLNP